MLGKTRGFTTAARGLLLGLSLNFALAASASAEAYGWYFGVSAGKSELDVTRRELDESVLSIFRDAGAQDIAGFSSLEKRTSTGSIFAGYHFSRYFSVESAYVDLGVHEYRLIGIGTSSGSAAATPATFSANLDVDGFTLSAIGSLPIGERFDLHAGAGVFYADSKVNSFAALDTESDLDRNEADTLELLWNVGAGFHFNRHWSASLDWRKYADVGDEEDTGEADIESLNLAVIFHF